MSELNERLGDCYKQAYMAITRGIGASDKRWALVHGYPKLTKEDQGQPVGTVYGHAWLEMTADGTAIVYDAVMHAFTRKDLYYEAGKIDPDQCVFFDKATAWDNLAEHATYGPWGDVPSDAKFADD